MKSKILSLMLALGIVIFCNDARAQTVPPACTAIIGDIAQVPPNTTQAGQDAVTCATSIAGAVAAPLCTAGQSCPTGKDCSACQPLCGSIYGAHDAACCLDALATAGVSLPPAVTNVLDSVCGVFASTTTIPVIGKQWCYGIPHAIAQQALPYIGRICCNYYSSTQNTTGVANTNACLGTTTPSFSCDLYTPAKICTSGSMVPGKKKEKDKE